MQGADVSCWRNRTEHRKGEWEREVEAERRRGLRIKPLRNFESKKEMCKGIMELEIEELDR
jgi:hypothetical protein